MHNPDRAGTSGRVRFCWDLSTFIRRVSWYELPWVARVWHLIRKVFFIKTKYYANQGQDRVNG